MTGQGAREPFCSAVRERVVRDMSATRSANALLHYRPVSDRESRDTKAYVIKAVPPKVSLIAQYPSKNAATSFASS